MPASKPSTPGTAPPEGTTPEDTSAATGNSVLDGVTTPPADPTAGSPRRKRTPREGPKAEVEFIIAVRNALKAGVDTEDVLDVLNFAVRANGQAAWRMVTATLDDLTEDTKDAESDEDTDES